MKADSHPRYRVFGCTITDITPHLFLVISQRAQQLVVRKGQEVDVLFSCQTFETLDVHAKCYCQRLKQSQASHFKGLFGREQFCRQANPDHYNLFSYII